MMKIFAGVIDVFAFISISVGVLIGAGLFVTILKEHTVLILCMLGLFFLAAVFAMSAEYVRDKS